ncbi:MAG TPA: hypothetical protein VN667_14545 [Burkholderiales bacterium]|nr:hypothetical protein [Burkholderiales bacterium]
MSTHAFPTKTVVIDREGTAHAADHPGMTLRDHFAAAALPLLAQVLHQTPCPEGRTMGEHVALVAYSIADRMLEERERRK